MARVIGVDVGGTKVATASLQDGVLGEVRTRARRVVGDEAQAVPVFPQLLDRLGAALDRGTRHVEDAIDVQEDARHAARF